MKGAIALTSARMITSAIDVDITTLGEQIEASVPSCWRSHGLCRVI